MFSFDAHQNVTPPAQSASAGAAEMLMLGLGDDVGV